ncbi:MAG TPA: lysylphosphatidylglycerol synthase transmembrane domain-containing protein [Gemmatales bacterium]|nr:lysylphosphatidylglycerol synthase transmembrane domain-containing protein [Gemmatales bacterium]
MAQLPRVNRNRIRFVQFAVRTLLSAIVAGYLASKLNWSVLGKLFSELHLGLVVLAFITIQVGQSFSSLRWQWLAQPLGFRDSYTRFRTLFYVGTFFNLFLPTSIGGDAVRAWLLAGDKKHRLSAFSSVIADRIAGVTAMLIMACMASLTIAGEVPWWIPVLPWVLLAGLLATVAMLPQFRSFSSKIEVLLMGLGWQEGRWLHWWKAVAISFVVQGLATLQIILLGIALGLQVPLTAYLVVVPMVTLMTMLPLSLSGHGIREGSLLILLAPYGVTTEQAIFLGLIWFTLSLGIGLIGVFLYVFSERARIPALQDTLPSGKDSHEPIYRRADEGRERQRQAAA